MSRGDLSGFADFDAVAGAARIHDVSEIENRGPAVFLIDAAAASSLDDGDLRSLVHDGSAVIGLNMSLAHLDRLTGFGRELESLNPAFGGYLDPGAVESGVRVGTYSLVWRTPDGANPAHWGSLEHHLDDGLFAAVIERQELLVRGLINDGDDIIPLEEYGRPNQ